MQLGDAFSSNVSGDGPRPQKLPGVSRPDRDLASERTLDPSTIDRRKRLLILFSLWLVRVHSIMLAALLSGEAFAASKWLALYGQHLYDTGAARGGFSETILAIVDQRRDWRRSLRIAWDVEEAWGLLIPVQSHMPMPSLYLLAMVSLAGLWGWWGMVPLLLIGFLGMLRPGEILRLTIGDIKLPSMLLLNSPTVYVGIRDPKMRRTSARREHIRIDEPWLCAFLEIWTAGRKASSKLFPDSAYLFRRKFDCLVQFFGACSRDGTGLTPASLRGGGATHFYQEGCPFDVVRWKGRWQAPRTVEIYIQEVAANSVLPGLTIQQREKLRRFAAAASTILLTLRHRA
jgi:hypothetical protein